MVGGVGLEGSLEDVEAMLDAEEVLELQGLPVATPVLEVPAVPATARGRRSKAVPVPAGTFSEAATTTQAALRKSSRYKGASASKPVLEKAMERVAEKNLETGNFVVLDHLPDSHFSTIASDCCIVFTPSAGTPAEALSLIRAKERLQGSLAAVARRQAQEAAEGAAREVAQPPATDVAMAQDPTRADQGVGDVEDEQTGQGLATGRGGDFPLTAIAGGSRRTRARAPRSGGRRTQLKDYMKQHRLDILGLQETIRQDFSTAELRSLECGGQFAWNWLPADGHSGGLLLGFRDESFEVGSWKKGAFFLSAMVFQRKTRLKWCFFLVYGPADHRRTDEFLVELEQEVLAAPFPVVVGGDFNLIRTAGDKSNDNICWPRVRRFNEAIATMALRELCRVGARFTWTNRQLNPIRCALDRVLISPAWEAAFPLCSLTAVTRIGSDHSPLLLDSGEETPRRQPRFFFQTWWFGVRGFQELMTGKLGGYLKLLGLDRGSIDVWHRVARNSRQFLKGWGANLGKEKRLFKEGLLAQVADLDRRADSSGLDEDDWALRYFLEDQLITLDRLDEEYWRQRSRLQWTLEGDSCTAYFHAIANGRRRKCAIPRLITDQGEIEDQADIMRHVYDFYIGLMGSAGEERVLSLASNLWDEEKRVSPEENLAMELTFTPEELDEVLLSMKADSAPGRVDIARLNFGVISLIPKVPGADAIRQFRPIALINVIFKFVAKAYAIRLAPLAHRIIDRSQTVFIRGRCLHEGVLALHEIAHELRAKKLGGLLLKLDFEKSYDCVNWDFLKKVLLRKGFSGMMVHRLMQLVMGGHTAVNVNGEVGAFFRNARGVRQGDPLSPILFDFLVDGLAALLARANEAGHIKGVVPHLIPGGVTHLQYADDTMVLIQPSDLGIANLKFLLLSFENMSGLKINFDKSEVFVTGVTVAEKHRVADMLNCKLGSLPMKYLGLPWIDPDSDNWRNTCSGAVSCSASTRSRRQMLVMKKRPTSGEKTKSLPNMVFIMRKERAMKEMMMPEEMVVEMPRARDTANVGPAGHSCSRASPEGHGQRQT
ncbi:hypothetical protein QYE76_011069 [Lolium multiflorum]|uniref:Reverse transcriptase domain-containing protein n=1 Tax=Lolium multiflorum TaxID=4521 RepID=A0AAD8TWR7_LOLMU|nr:hypothetical protein QYE76_011069 [Lolium multiflorum]